MKIYLAILSFACATVLISALQFNEEELAQLMRGELYNELMQESTRSRSRGVPNRPNCSSFGEYSYSGPIIPKCWLGNNSYSVGKFCSIGYNLTIFLDGNHRADWISTYPFPAFKDKFPEAHGIPGFVATHGDVVIGNDVWMGENVTLLSGVTIGDGAVIGTGAVVGKSIPSYAIAVGNPVKIVRYRFDQKTIDKLLKIQWWNWPIHLIRQYAPLLCTNDIQAFLDACENNNLSS